jgi:peptidoglycan/xylan/chitin deacetylase (PgdA/CDA1 family)
VGTTAVIVFCSLLLLGGAALLTLWLRESRLPRVICLMYHRIVPTETYLQTKGTERVYALPADEFQRQVVYLKENGYTFLTPDDVIETSQGRWTGGQGVLITFDDGCVSVHDVARPILQRHGATAVSFVTVDPASYVFHLGGLPDRRMTEVELRTCAAAGISVQSHAVTHRPLRGLSDDEIRRELAESKQELERIIRGPVEAFAVPGNWWDTRVMRIAREVGFRSVYVSTPGTIRAGTRLFGLPRVNIEGQLTLAQFAAAIRPFGVAQRIAAFRLKSLPARFLGPRVWLPLRKVLFRLIPGGHMSTRRVILTAGSLAALGACAVIAWLLAR